MSDDKQRKRTMNKEQQRIAIAEACGWQLAEGHKYLDMKWLTPDNEWAFESEMPDYCNDLNAMHEAEKILPTIREVMDANDNRRIGHTPQVYWWYLCSVTGLDAYETAVNPLLTVSATAAQRAEAFLKTIGKWEGEHP